MTVKVLDLFSGVGGFSLGLERSGMETVAFCEADKEARKVLKKHWPDVPIYNDVKKLTRAKLEQDGIDTSSVGLICGGFPCQPYSRSGVRRGKEDDRDLWPEMYRLVSEINSPWVLGENVAGFVDMELDRTVSDLEAQDYEVKVFVLGAVSVQAPHERQRCWIIGRKRNVFDPECDGFFRPKVGEGFEEKLRNAKNGQNDSFNFAGASVLSRAETNVADSKSLGHRRGDGEKRETRKGKFYPGKRQGGKVGSEIERRSHPHRENVADSPCPRSEIGVSAKGPGESFSAKKSNDSRDRRPRREEPGDGSTFSRLDGTTNGFPKRLDGSLDAWGIGWEDGTPRLATGQQRRAIRIKQMGNAVVPQLTEILGSAILETEKNADKWLKNGE